MKAYDAKIRELTAVQNKKFFESLQTGVIVGLKTNIILNDPRTTFEVKHQIAKRDEPIYKDAKSDEIYALVTMGTFEVISLFQNKRSIYSNAYKTTYPAIIDDLSIAAAEWIVIYNPVFEVIGRPRIDARKGATSYERQIFKYKDDKEVKHLVDKIRTALKDTEYAHDDYIAIAKRAAIATRDGDPSLEAELLQKMFNDDDFEYDAIAPFKLLYKKFLEQYSNTYSPQQEETFKSKIKNNKGYPWTPSPYRDGFSDSTRDKSGYNTALGKYIWKRSAAYADSDDNSAFNKLEKEYNDFIENIMQPGFERLIKSDGWELLKKVIDKLEELKKLLDRVLKSSTEKTPVARRIALGDMTQALNLMNEIENLLKTNQ